MRYEAVFINSLGYQLAPVVISSSEIEERLAPVYDALRLPVGHLEELTGIIERRWWGPSDTLSQGAIQAASKALARSSLQASDLGMLVYAGVCREQFEPATACRIAHGLGLSSEITLYDLSNACLGVLNGMVEVANRIALGQIRAGIVVSCESSQHIMEEVMDDLVRDPRMDRYLASLATLTGGSGAAAVILANEELSRGYGHRLRGGVALAAPEHHSLCRWGMQLEADGKYRQYMATDSGGIMKHGLALGQQTWRRFLQEMEWTPTSIDRVICHQVGAPHREQVLQRLELPLEKDFASFPYLGNMGTVSLPLTAAMAEEQQFLQPAQRVGWLGIGSGLTCLMLGMDW